MSSRKILPCLITLGLINSHALARTLQNCDGSQVPRYHKVVKNNTLGGIAKAYGFWPIWGRGQFVEKISRLNNLRNRNKILPGQLIELPWVCKAVPTEPVSTPITAPPQLNSVIQNAEKTSEMPEKSDEFLSQLSAGIKTGFMIISSTDNFTKDKADLVSSPILGFDIGYQTNWTEKFATSLQFSFQKIKMRASSIGTINNAENNLSDIELNFKYRVSSAGLMSFTTHYGERLFVRGTDVGVATLDKILVPAFGLEYRHTLFSKTKTTLDVFGGYRVILGTDFKNNKIENGSEYYFGPALIQKFEKHSLELKLNYLENEQNSELFDQSTSSLGAHARMIWELH